MTGKISDQEYRSGIAGMRNIQVELMQGAQSIFRDIAWQHRAYEASGIGALRHVRDDETMKGRPNSFLFNTWLSLDAALANNNSTEIENANQQLLERAVRHCSAAL